MNILFLIPEEFMAKRWGGVTSYTLDMAGSLKKLGQSVEILTPGSSSQTSNHMGITIHKIPPAKPNSLHSKIANKLFAKLLPAFFSRINWARAVKTFVYKNPKFDVIESPEWGASTFFLSFFKKTKVVVRLHRSWIQYLSDNRLPVTASDRLASLTEYIAIVKASGITSPTRFMAKKYNTLIATLLRFRTHFMVIPNSVTKSYSTQSPKNKLGDYILTVGRIEPGKGSITLAHAFEKIHEVYPDISLVFIGEDTTIQINKKSVSCIHFIKTKILTKKTEEKVFFLPRIPRKNLSQFYKNCLFYVAPSHGHENPSLSLLEALSQGKAVVASKTGGIPEFVRDGYNGLLVKTADVGDLKNKIINLIKNRDLRKRLEKNSFGEIYTMEKVAKMTLSFYQKVTQN